MCLGLSLSSPPPPSSILHKRSFNHGNFPEILLAPQLYRPSYYAKAELDTDNEPDLAT